MENKVSERKISLLLLFSLAATVFSFSAVSAHFVCGQVLNSPDNVSAAWMPVNVFYPATPAKFTTCQVSPQGDKYCCDTEAKNLTDPSGFQMGKAWTIGSVVSADVYSPSTGYSAGPVSLTTTGNGYDLFPDMQMQKVISIYSPNASLIISNDTEISLNATFVSPYNNVILYNGTSDQVLCPNCSNFFGNVSAQGGMNYWTIYANSGSGAGAFSQNLSFALLKSIDAKQTAECRGCKNFPFTSVPQDMESNCIVSLVVRLAFLYM